MERSVSFESGRFRLWGMLHLPPGSGRAPGVVMCHGFTGNHIEAHFLFTKTARALAAAGLAVLRFDFRGSGDSEGFMSDVTIAGEIEDAERALEWMAGFDGVDPDRLGVIGLSLGGCVAACLAGRRPEVKAVALWAAVAHPGRILTRLVASSPERQAELDRNGFIDIGGHGISRAFLEGSAQIEPMVEIARSRASLLILHGGEDQVVPLSDAADYLQAADCSGRTVELATIDGADHVFSRLAWEQQVIALTRDFLRTQLG